MASERTNPKNASVRRYRQRHRRIDYYPSVEAMRAIERWKGRGLDHTIAGTIDKMIIEADMVASGKRR